MPWQRFRKKEIKTRKMALNKLIDNFSNLIVNKYVEEGISLNETITKIARVEHFNDDHIARLVEASNKKTFLRLYPEKHSFDVASVRGVKEILNSSQSNTENTAGDSMQTNTYVDINDSLVNYKYLDLYKETAATVQKEASGKVMPRHELDVAKGKIKRAIEELGAMSRQKRSEMLNCADKLVDLTKQALLRGVDFSDLETYSLSMLDEKQKEASEVLDRVYGRVKDMQFIGKRASERGCYIESFVGKPNIYSNLIENIIKCAYEELPLLEGGIELLQDKLDKIES